MTTAKRRLPGTAYFVTGVCDRHEFRLKPTKETQAAFAFTLCESAMAHGIDVIAVCQMSSHYHAVVYDRTGKLSDFLRDFHGVMGRFGNARDEVENTKFWSAQDSETVELGDMEAVIAKVAYALANPTKDFIVEDPEEWVGVMTPVAALGTGVGKVYERPKRFFDEDGRTSEAVMLGSDYPWELEELMPISQFRERVKVEVARYVAAARAEVAAGRRAFSGLKKAMAYSFWHSTGIDHDRGAGKGSRARRRVAAAAREGRLKAMLEALVAWRKAYREAWESYRRGIYEVVFPAGTWFAWRYYGAKRGTGVNDTFEAPS